MTNPTRLFQYRMLNSLTGQIDDLEELRISLANRRRILVMPLNEPDKDGTCRGFGISPDDAEILGPIDEVLAGTGELEQLAIKSVERYMKNSPWAPWLARPQQKGVGAKQFARLLGATGDPYWHGAEDRPRLVSELWSYCGYAVVDGVAPRRQRGTKSNWSENARKRAWLIATSCMKSGGYYRTVYDNVKLHYADAVHDHECIRCGPSGKPAAIGTPISDGHRHARALRGVSKELLRNAWIFGRYLHGDGDDQVVHTPPPIEQLAESA